MKRGSFFHLFVCLACLSQSAVIEHYGNFILVGDQAPRMNLQSLINRGDGLWYVFEVSEQEETFELSGMVFPWCMKNGFAMEF